MVITKEQVIRILRSEQELQRRLLSSLSGELARFRNGTELIAQNWLGPSPVFKVVSNHPDESDAIQIIEALRREEYDLLCNKKIHC